MCNRVRTRPPSSAWRPSTTSSSTVSGRHRRGRSACRWCGRCRAPTRAARVERRAWPGTDLQAGAQGGRGRRCGRLGQRRRGAADGEARAVADRDVERELVAAERPRGAADEIDRVRRAPHDERRLGPQLDESRPAAHDAVAPMRALVKASSGRQAGSPVGELVQNPIGDRGRAVGVDERGELDRQRRRGGRSRRVASPRDRRRRAARGRSC